MEFKIDVGRKHAKALAKEIILSCFNEELIPIEAAKKAAYWLFSVTAGEFGAEEARLIFLKLGQAPSAGRLKKIKNYGWLDRYDRMKPRPSKAELARQLFAENAALPKGKRSTTTLTSFEKQITRLVKEREEGLREGIWHGPVTVKQAIRYHGAKKFDDDDA